METTLQKITEKPHYYKWCKACNCFNHIENESCHNCGSNDFKQNITIEIEEEKTFQGWHQGLEPHEVYLTVK